MIRSAPRLLLALALAAGCGACTGAPPAPQVAPAPGAITLPPRPYDVPIDGIDPCSLLTPAQLRTLQLDGEPDSYTNSGRLLGTARNCIVLGFDGPNVAVVVALAPETGVERYAGGDLRTDVSPLVVEGFPGVLAKPRDFAETCNVVVDVAPEQLLYVDYSDGGGNGTLIPRDQLCASAQRTASEVMRTLLAL